MLHICKHYSMTSDSNKLHGFFYCANFTVQKPETYFQLNSSKTSIHYIEKLIQRTVSKQFTTGLQI